MGLNLSSERKDDGSQSGNRPAVSLTVPLLLSLAVCVSTFLHLLPERQLNLGDRFERLRTDMTRSQVNAVMGRPGGDSPSWKNVPTHAICWTAESGKPERQEFEPPMKVYWLDPGPADPGRGLEVWAAGNAEVCVRYDEAGRMSQVLWLEERTPSGGRTRFWGW
jgi:hypothetical protein